MRDNYGPRIGIRGHVIESAVRLMVKTRRSIFYRHEGFKFLLSLALLLSLGLYFFGVDHRASESDSASVGSTTLDSLVWVPVRNDGVYLVPTVGEAGLSATLPELTRSGLSRRVDNSVVALDFTRILSTKDALQSISNVNLDLVSLRGPVDLFIQTEIVNSLATAKRLSIALTRCDDKSFEQFMAIYGDRLVALGLDETGVSDTIGQSLTGRSMLRTLSLEQTQITEALLPSISGSTQIEVLNLGDTPISSRIAPELTQLNSLKILMLKGTRVVDDIVAHLAQLKKLRRLDLSNTQLGDGIGAALERLDQVETLVLKNTKVTSHVGAGLSRMKNLKWLDLRQTAIDNEIGPSLERMEQLKQLILSGTRVGDPVLEHLSDLPNLEILKLERTRVTKIAIKQLDAALDNCTVAF